MNVQKIGRTDIEAEVAMISKIEQVQEVVVHGSKRKAAPVPESEVTPASTTYVRFFGLDNLNFLKYL